MPQQERLTKFSYWFFFPSGTFPSAFEAHDFIKDCIGFKIEQIVSKPSFGMFDWYNEAEVTEKFKINNDQSFTLAGNRRTDYDDFEMVLFRREPHRETDIFVISVVEELSFNLALFLFKADALGFSFGYMKDAIKSQWQNQMFIDQFKTFKVPLPKNYKTRMDKNFGEVIDTSYNPGRVQPVKYMHLYAAPEMWFGKKALEYFDKQKLLSFPDALDIKELSKTLVYINLFDYDVPDWETPEILELQAKFRVWTGMNEIEKSLLIP